MSVTNTADLWTPEELTLCGEGSYPSRWLIEAFDSGESFCLRYSKPNCLGAIVLSLACVGFCAGFYYFGLRDELPLGFFLAISAALLLGLVGTVTPAVVAWVRNGRSVLDYDQSAQTINLRSFEIQIRIGDVICIQESLLDTRRSSSFDRSQLAEVNIVAIHEGQRRRFNIAKSSLTINPFGFVPELQNALKVPLVKFNTNGIGVDPSIVVVQPALRSNC